MIKPLHVLFWILVMFAGIWVMVYSITLDPEAGIRAVGYVGGFGAICVGGGYLFKMLVP